MAGAKVVLTDSGGLQQEEAYWARVPCVTLQPEIEWTETICKGCNRLAEPNEIAAAVDSAGPGYGDTEAYGGGDASEQIARLLIAHQCASVSSPPS